MQKYTFNEDFFETIDSEEKAYWLGFIAADGCLSLKRIHLSLVLAEKDLSHLIKFREAIQAEKSLYKRYHKKQNTYSYKLSLYSFKMYNDLLDKGIIPRKSLTLKPPLNVPDNLIRHWIRGYFDGDGSIFISKRDQKTYISILGTKEVLGFILKESEIEWEIHSKDTSKAYFIGGCGNKALKFLSFIYDNSNIFLDRKKERYLNYHAIKKVA